eukprot:544127-Prorocentrum_minimum.AAC.1
MRCASQDTTPLGSPSPVRIWSTGFALGFAGFSEVIRAPSVSEGQYDVDVQSVSRACAPNARTAHGRGAHIALSFMIPTVRLLSKFARLSVPGPVLPGRRRERLRDAPTRSVGSEDADRRTASF